MPKKHRLSRADFKEFRPKKRLEGALFTASLSHKMTTAPAKIACVVSKKVANKAHERNLLRRRMRAVIEKSMPKLPAGLNIVFMAKNKAKAANFTDIETDINLLMGQILSLPPMVAKPTKEYNT